MRDIELRAAAQRMSTDKAHQEMFQAKVVGNNSNGTMDVSIGGVTYTNVPKLDGIYGTLDQSCWIYDLGKGRWLVIGVVVSPFPGAWTAVTFQNSWINAYSGIAPAQYRRVGDMVSVRGRISNGASATTAFTLPVGFRPPRDNGLYPCSGWNGSNPQVAFVAISPLGVFNPYYGAGMVDLGFEMQFSTTL